MGLNSVLAQAPISISFGPVQIGEKRIKINLDNFQVKATKNTDIIKARIIKGTTQWIRTKENFLSPRVLVSISVKSQKTVSLKHHGKNLILQGDSVKNGKLYLNIFDPQEIKVFVGNEQIDQLILNSNVKLSNKKGHLIDYSCSYFGIDVQGLDDQYLSLGCRMERVGPIGKERSRLVLTWSTTNYVLESEQRSPFTSVLMSSDAININMINAQGERRQVKISAKFKKRFHRLKLALGLGPYGMDSKEGLKQEKDQIAPAVMLYGKWDLTPESSFRGFNALLKSKSLFNNAGLYFAYDIATAFDNRFKLVPLLGAQYLTYKFDSNSKTNNKFIYPQGFEAVFKHIFGIKNYHMTYGMFLSTQTDETYDNIWLRWGRGYFWELNYIRWGRDNQEVETYGLSVGFPIGNFF
jgi:hypothetical protein